MDITTIVKGSVSIVILIAVPLTIPVSIFLLWRYHQAVLMGMRKKTSEAGDESINPPAKRGAKEWSSSAFAPLNLPGYSNKNKWVDEIKRSMRTTAIVYGFAGLIFVSIMAAAELYGDFSTIGFNRIVFFILLLSYPILLATNLIVATDQKLLLKNWSIYLFVFITLSVYEKAISPTLTAWMIIISWLSLNALPFLFIQILIHKRIRSIGPLVFGMLLITASGIIFALNLLLAIPAFFNAYLKIVTFLNLVVFLTLPLGIVGFVLAIPFGWLFLAWIGRQYANKQISDQSILIDLIWIIFGCYWSLLMASNGLGWILTGLVAFIVYKLALKICFGFVNVKSKRVPRLLLLRVFSLGIRSENLYAKFSQMWRYIGTIQFITGPDLVRTTLQPHHLLNFLGGRLLSLFVESRSTLVTRMEQLDNSPDPDQRYRINDFFCHDNTWKIVLKRLASDCDAVLMDLRSFSSSNAGCKFEINELFQSVPLSQVIFVVDSTTDRQFMSDGMKLAWENLRADSPNYEFDGKVQLFQYDGSGRKEFENLFSVVTSMLEEPVSETI